MFNIGGEIGAAGTSYQYASVLLETKGERRNEYFTFTRGIWNNTPRGLVIPQPVVERLQQIAARE